MNQNPPPHDSQRGPSQSLPPVGKGVRVRHRGRECFAYLDAQGKWRNYDNGDPLIGDVTLLTLPPF